MGAVNGPVNEKKELPEQAKGNPVYEQTRQDMPLWCCGRNCGRNSRITVFILGIIGICASCIVCLSPHYFHFESVRIDTFCLEGDIPDKLQPKPFEYATEANVGLFRYQILEVFEYPWPPKEQRELFDAMHNRELERLAAFDEENVETPHSMSFNIFNRLLQQKFPDEFYDDDNGFSNEDATDEDDLSNPSVNTTVYQNDTTAILLTRAPADSPIDIKDDDKDDDYSGGDATNKPTADVTDEGSGDPNDEDDNSNASGSTTDEIPEVKPGSTVLADPLPTSSPTSSPTRGNRNELIDVRIGVVESYPAGSELDKLFKNGQSGAMWAPILATIGLIFASIEFFCCIYKCSWLPTAIFLYTAFMLQLMTMFLFMSEDFCDYKQDCTLGPAGFMSVIAVICYLICQMLVCMTPRPPPKYNLLKKPPVRRKKKKKKKPNEFEDDEKESLSQDRFNDESSFAGSSRYLDPDDDPYSSHYGDSKSYRDGYDNDYKDGNSNDYNDGYDQEGYNDGYDQERNTGYDNYDGSYDKSDDRSYDNHAENHEDYDNVDQRSYDKDSEASGDHDSVDQRSYDNDAQTYDDYNENYEEAPSSSSSRRSKK